MRAEFSEAVRLLAFEFSVWLLRLLSSCHCLTLLNLQSARILLPQSGAVLGTAYMLTVLLQVPNEIGEKVSIVATGGYSSDINPTARKIFY